MVKPLNNFFLVFGCQVPSGLHANPLTRPLTQSFHSTCTCMLWPTFVLKSSKSWRKVNFFSWPHAPSLCPQIEIPLLQVTQTAPELGPWPVPLGILRSRDLDSENRVAYLTSWSASSLSPPTPSPPGQGRFLTKSTTSQPTALPLLPPFVTTT